MKKIKRIVNGIIIAAIWMAVWITVSLIVDNELIIPRLSTIAVTFAKLLIQPGFWLSALISIATIFAGFLVANIAGILLGVASAKSIVVRKILQPAINAVRATPVASFIIVLLIWFGKSKAPSITAFLMVFPVVWQNVLTGILQADNKLIEVADVYEIGFAKRIKYVYFPAAFPSYIASVKTGLGLAWKAGVAAEVLCNAKNTLGGAIYDSKIYLEIPELFAWTAAVIIISIVIEKLTLFAIEKITGRRTEK